MLPYSSSKSNPGDTRVHDLLKALKLNYEFHDPFFYFHFQDSATQGAPTIGCAIQDSTYLLEGHEMREITFIFLEGAPAWSIETFLYLMHRNRYLGCGAWALISERPNAPDPTPVFVLNVSADLETGLASHLLQFVLHEMVEVRSQVKGARQVPALLN